MPKPPNINLRNKVLEFIKMEYLKNDGEPISLSLAEIAKSIGEGNKAEKIMRQVNILEKRGNIKIHRGEGSRANKYEFLSNDVKSLVGNSSKKLTTDLSELFDKLNGVIKEIIDYTGSVSRENIELQGQLNYYKNSLLKIEPFGKTQEGKSIFIATEQTSSFGMILNEVKKEFTKEEVVVTNEE